MNYLKFIAVLTLTSCAALLPAAGDDQTKAVTDKTTEPADIKPADKAGDKADKKADKAFDKKAVRKTAQGINREERPLLMYIEKLSAEDKAKLRELYQQDPEKFRKELKAKVQELRKQESGVQKNISGLAEKYHKAQTPEEKQKYLAQLKEASQKEFNRNLERSKTELDTLEKRLNTLRQAYENRKNNADKIIDDQVEYLTRDPSLQW